MKIIKMIFPVESFYLLNLTDNQNCNETRKVDTEQMICSI